MRIRVTILFLLFFTLATWAQGQVYMCEIGLQGGCGYYVGDATSHIFMNPREAYGLHFRYKFTKRWALQVKVSGQRITGHDYTYVKNEGPKELDTWWTNRLYNADVMAEFNFLRFGSANKFDKRIKPYTPYIFIGLGAGVYTPDWKKMGVSGYIPLGIGFKWKFSERCGLNIAWQHNIYFADDLENRSELNNRKQLNGWNWMNCDLTGMLTVGLVVEFAQPTKNCRVCNTD